MHTAYKFRLYPNAAQRVLFAKHFGCARWAYNYALDLKTKTYNTTGKSLSQFDLMREFPKLKKQEKTAWLGEVCSHSLQCAMGNLDMAYTKFFREKKGFPKFKSKRDRKSYSTNVNITVGDNFVSLPKVGKVKASLSREIVGRIQKATVSQTATGKYFVSIACTDDKDVPKKKRVTDKSTVGIDLGIKHFATFSTGEKIDNPKHLDKSLRKLARAQRVMARRKKGGSNRNKARLVVASIHEKISECRKDFQHKLSTRLIRENQAVAIESLNVSGMQKNPRLARAISDAGWAQFVSMLDYKAERYGKTVLRIGRFEPSSKLCSCGVLNDGLKLSDRVWTCASCGVTHDRDVLAANNIKRMALHPQNQIGRDTPEFTLGETTQ